MNAYIFWRVSKLSVRWLLFISECFLKMKNYVDINIFLFTEKIMHVQIWICCEYRSSPPEVFCRIGGLRNFAKLTGKHLCQSLFCNKVAGLKFIRAPFFTEHLRWLLLWIVYDFHSKRLITANICEKHLK